MVGTQCFPDCALRQLLKNNGFLQGAFLAFLLGTAAPFAAHAQTMETSAAQDLGIKDPGYKPTGSVTEPVGFFAAPRPTGPNEMTLFRC